MKHAQCLHLYGLYYYEASWTTSHLDIRTKTTHSVHGHPYLRAPWGSGVGAPDGAPW